MTGRCWNCGCAASADVLVCPACHVPYAPGRNTRRDRVVPLPEVQPPPPHPYAPQQPHPAWSGRAEPDPAPPDAPLTRTLVIVAVAVALVMAATIVGVVYIRRRGTTGPREWDPRVTSIVRFVEHERGLTFRHPVTVEFLTPEQYHSAALGRDTIDAPGHEPAGGTTEDDGVAELRALGLVSGRVDLQAASDTLTDSATLAFYSPTDKRVRVRGTELTPGVRDTLAHELTHALQDQYFDLAGHLVDQDALRAVVEGDATRVERAYASQVLTDAERQEKAATEDSARTAVKAQLDASAVPEVVTTAFTLRYAIGPQFVAITAARGGNRAVDAVIRRPPASEVTLLDPLRAAAGPVAVSVPAPVLPPGAKVLDGTPLGAGLLYLLLGERLEPADALDAAVTWAGEASVVSRQAGRVCVDTHIRTGDDSGALLAGMTAWAAAMPAQAGASVRGDARNVEVHACDPGADVMFTVPARTAHTLTFVAVRSEIELDLVRDVHADAARAECVADRSARTISAADLAADGYVAAADTELAAAVEQAAAVC